MLISEALEGKYYRSYSRGLEGVIQYAERREICDKHYDNDSTSYAYTIQVRPTFHAGQPYAGDFYSTLWIGLED